jgi:hypothetical protein
MVSGALAATVKTRFSRRKNAFSLIRDECKHAMRAAPHDAHFSSLQDRRLAIVFPSRTAKPRVARDRNERPLRDADFSRAVK